MHEKQKDFVSKSKCAEKNYLHSWKDPSKNSCLMVGKQRRVHQTKVHKTERSTIQLRDFDARRKPERNKFNIYLCGKVSNSLIIFVSRNGNYIQLKWKSWKGVVTTYFETINFTIETLIQQLVLWKKRFCQQKSTLVIFPIAIQKILTVARIRLKIICFNLDALYGFNCNFGPHK